MARKRRKYTLEFKQEAVRLVTQEGMTFAQVGQDLGVNKSTIRDWCLRSQEGRLVGPAQGAKEESMEDELARLRREELGAGRGLHRKRAGFGACLHTEDEDENRDRRAAPVEAPPDGRASPLAARGVTCTGGSSEWWGLGARCGVMPCSREFTN